ncbi:hypothetical protein GUJ93_ZPchr0001g30507 [Zizania palustris]|uniref:Uncharacterized protein n=1 Tax=Zizania palustris TaxID=103762 RepID=A0A8J5RUD7_ZIZPA|nr:hypothetical protein GUJ93_ZPchr0001g30507 [Zizania palustris]
MAYRTSVARVTLCQVSNARAQGVIRRLLLVFFWTVGRELRLRLLRPPAMRGELMGDLDMDTSVLLEASRASCGSDNGSTRLGPVATARDWSLKVAVLVLARLAAASETVKGGTYIFR